jgi:hypothetical protein
MTSHHIDVHHHVVPAGNSSKSVMWQAGGNRAQVLASGDGRGVADNGIPAAVARAWACSLASTNTGPVCICYGP